MKRAEIKKLKECAETAKSAGCDIDDVPPELVLRLIEIVEWADDAKQALEWERKRCGVLCGPLGETLAKFPGGENG